MVLDAKNAFLELRRWPRTRRFQRGRARRRKGSIVVIVGSYERENRQTRWVATDAVFGQMRDDISFWLMKCCLSIGLQGVDYLLYSTLVQGYHFPTLVGSLLCSTSQDVVIIAALLR